MEQPAKPPAGAQAGVGPTTAWAGPVNGRIGVLERDGDRLECHCCGRWYRSLGSHVTQAHHLLADDYRAIFGLRARTSLDGPSVRAGKRERAPRVLAAYWEQSPLKTRSPEQRAADIRGRRWPAEAKLDPANQELWRTAPWRVRAGERTRQRLRDPEEQAAFARKVSAAKGGRVAITCAVCGQTVLVPRHRSREGHRRLCGRPDCATAFRRRATRERPPSASPEARRKISEGLRRRRGGEHYARIVAGLRALDPTVFATVPADERELVRLYYGLTDGAVHSHRELCARFAMTRGQVAWRLERGLRRLLGEAGGGRSDRDASAAEDRQGAGLA
jgi:hypothetical protein